MTDLVKTLEFFAVFAMAIEIGFETIFSLPWVDVFFKQKDRSYVKRLVVLAFCLILCSVLYAATDPAQGALFLERTFGVKIPVVDIVLTALILTSGSRVIHDTMNGVGGLAKSGPPEGKRG